MRHENDFHAADYIFIMTPWESLLQSNDGSLIIKQLALIAFFILEYICIYVYIYIYLSLSLSLYIYTYTKFSGRGFESHSGQLSIAASKIPSVVNTICINSCRY